MMYILEQLLAVHHNPSPANLIYLNFHPLEVLSRYSDPQLQVTKNDLHIIYNLN